MSHMFIDAKADFTAWPAFGPDGVTTSALLSCGPDTSLVRHGPDHKSLRVTARAGATGHRLRWKLPATDLSGHDELRCYVRADRVADGSSSQPFYLELRVGNAALPPDAEAAWRRFLPVARADTWELVRLGLSDLPGTVRSSLDRFELRCVDDASFTVWIDDLLAVREEMIADAEAALVERLHERLTLGSDLVKAAVISPDGQALTKPYIRIEPFDLRYVEERAHASRSRRDHVVGGYSVAAPSHHYELVYRIDVFAEDRASEATMMEFLLRELGPRSELIVAGTPTTIEWVQVPRVERPDGRVSLFYRIAARQEVGSAERVKSTSQVLVDLEFRMPA